MKSILKFTDSRLEGDLDAVVGGGSYCPPAPTKKGNNGFGNGSDDPNLAAPGGSGKTGGGKEDSIGDDRGAR
jgi:hypothetical protein